ncbi:phage terminase small subunit P27 family [Marinobacter sp.]|uniref:phage terminase small subunit P27 family n=1 Tax=Marinobacter sp. TaxID=50741 RepID=UPI003563F8C8
MKNCPDHLTDDAKGWWNRLQTEYGIDDRAGLLLLQTAMEAFDRMRDAQAAISKDGLTVEDRFGQLKNHPATTVERDARTQLLSALKALNLDLEPLNDAPGRPPEV